MATFKHLSSKNADYGAAEKYLLFEHDEFINKPVLDESGRIISYVTAHDNYFRQVMTEKMSLKSVEIIKSAKRNLA